MASYTFQGQIFNVGLATSLLRRAIFDGSLEIVDHMEEHNVGYNRAVRGAMLNIKASARIRWGAENTEVSLAQFKKRQSTGFD